MSTWRRKPTRRPSRSSRSCDPTARRGGLDRRSGRLATRRGRATEATAGARRSNRVRRRLARRMGTRTSRDVDLRPRAIEAPDRPTRRIRTGRARMAARSPWMVGRHHAHAGRRTREFRQARLDATRDPARYDGRRKRTHRPGGRWSTDRDCVSRMKFIADSSTNAASVRVRESRGRMRRVMLPRDVNALVDDAGEVCSVETLDASAWGSVFDRAAAERLVAWVRAELANAAA